jgi:hypothetical protein
LNRHANGRDDRLQLLGMLLGSVRSAMMKRAMRASSGTVSVTFRLSGSSKSNRIGS